jgi:prefoldin subunit 5
MATERMSLLSRQLEMAKDSLSQLESQMETVNWKDLELESAKEWD